MKFNIFALCYFGLFIAAVASDNGKIPLRVILALVVGATAGMIIAAITK